MLNTITFWKKKSLLVYIVIGLIFIFFVFFIITIFSGQTEVFSQVVDTVGGKADLKKASDDRINILIIGVDKRVSKNSVESGHLTDTIILVSINPKDKTYLLMSFPRDIWINDKFGGAGIDYSGKINAVYATSGVDTLIKVIENLTKQKIQYHVTLSFSGFVQAIDAIGGIEVYVENTFDDFAYPIEGKENDLCGLAKEDVDKIFEELDQQTECIKDNTCVLFDNQNSLEDAYKNIKDDLQQQFDDMNDKAPKTFEEFLAKNIEKDGDNFTYETKKYELKIDDLNFPCRYETVHFEKGLQKMDGITALKYARSRHSLSEEGSDFARAKRQQIVINATKNKALSFSTFSNPVKLKNLYDAYKDNLETDISFFEAQSIYNMLSNLENVGSYVLGITDDEGGLFESLYGGKEYSFAFVLIAKNQNFNVVSDFVTKVWQIKATTK